VQDSLKNKLERLRTDFSAVVGRPFSSFYCPILFKDEDVELCEAHIINKAFRNSPKNWTVQRRDVDHFYGAHFESDFVDIQYVGRLSPDQMVVDKHTASKFQPQIYCEGGRIDHYPARGPVPKDHSRLTLETDIGTVNLGLKISTDRAMSLPLDSWQIVVEKDLRLAALVTLIKSAYLTLFELLGYRYALSASGRFVGNTILGEFFDKTRSLSRQGVLAEAPAHFREFKNLVRPVLRSGAFDCTVRDRRLMICETSQQVPWAFGVFVRVDDRVNTVLLPILESAESAGRFAEFLKSRECRIHSRFTIFESERFSASPETATLLWPEVT
jgi:hypothetical protein